MVNKMTARSTIHAGMTSHAQQIPDTIQGGTIRIRRACSTSCASIWPTDRYVKLVCSALTDTTRTGRTSVAILCGVVLHRFFVRRRSGLRWAWSAPR
jgi:hypothetical protein